MPELTGLGTILGHLLGEGAPQGVQISHSGGVTVTHPLGYVAAETPTHNVRKWVDVVLDAVAQYHWDEIPDDGSPFTVKVGLMEVAMCDKDGEGIHMLRKRYGPETAFDLQREMKLDCWVVEIVPDRRQEVVVGSWEPTEVSDMDVTEYLL